jgi:transposase InsO family protein
MKDSLWSVDLFRCESILLRSHWVMVMMDVFTRRIIGFGVDRADLSGVSLCRMFNQIIVGQSLPQHLSSDHDPLFRFHRWVANLRILEVEEIKSIPYVPMSHPFVERLIGTIRREFLDHVLIWNAVDLERSELITTNIAFTSRSMAALRESDLANRRPPVLSLLATLGSTIAAGCSRCRSRRNLRFRHGQAKAGGVQDLLQRASRSPVALRAHSGRTIWPAAAYPRRP